ncbi:MAG: hypothetical protein KatS3mg032_0071 [Cyclobacteriaceae bacterium]|nr:MAG: hypothetical protein KatS3mg032_0071 [Cyclobacteriaceae bacterium]
MNPNYVIGVFALFLLMCTSRQAGTETASTVLPDSTGLAADGSLPAITEASKNLPLDRINLPPGFTIEVYAEVDNARSLALSPSGTLFVGNRNGDKVYALRDEDRDNRADKKWIIASGLNMPNGVAFKDGDLFVSEVNRVWRFKNIEASLGKSTPARAGNRCLPG